MSKITVTTIAGLTSGGDANKVKIEDGATLEVVNGSQTINRTGNGDLIAFQKGGVDSGSISIETNGTAFDGEASHAGLKMFATQIAPRQNGADIDNTIDLGSATIRFKDIFISGGLKVGGTGAANTLDDYEEGTWTPFYTTANNNLTLNGNASTTASMYTTQSGSYVKIGKKVICHMSIATNGVTSHAGSGNLGIGGLPFTTSTTTASEPRGVNGAMAGRFSSFTPDQLVCNSNATTLQIRAGFESYPTRSNLDTGGSTNRNVIEALIVYSVA